MRPPPRVGRSSLEQRKQFGRHALVDAGPHVKELARAVGVGLALDPLGAGLRRRGVRGEGEGAKVCSFGCPFLSDRQGGLALPRECRTQPNSPRHAMETLCAVNASRRRGGQVFVPRWWRAPNRAAIGGGCRKTTQRARPHTVFLLDRPFTGGVRAGPIQATPCLTQQIRGLRAWRVAQRRTFFSSFFSPHTTDLVRDQVFDAVLLARLLQGGFGACLVVRHWRWRRRMGDEEVVVV